MGKILAPKRQNLCLKCLKKNYALIIIKMKGSFAPYFDSNWILPFILKFGILPHFNVFRSFAPYFPKPTILLYFSQLLAPTNEANTDTNTTLTRKRH